VAFALAWGLGGWAARGRLSDAVDQCVDVLDERRKQLAAANTDYYGSKDPFAFGLSLMAGYQQAINDLYDTAISAWAGGFVALVLGFLFSLATQLGLFAALSPAWMTAVVSVLAVCTVVALCVFVYQGIRIDRERRRLDRHRREAATSPALVVGRVRLSDEE
jgi:hypothetical protein